MKKAFATLALVIALSSFGTAHAKVTEMDPDLAQSQWVLSLLSDGYYVGTNTEGDVVIIKEGTSVVALVLSNEGDVLSCMRGTVTGNIITGTTGTVIDLSNYYLAGEGQDDHMPDAYNWSVIRADGDACKRTLMIEKPAQPHEVRAPAAP